MLSEVRPREGKEKKALGVVDAISYASALKHGVVPVRVDGDTLVVEAAPAVAQGQTQALREAIEKLSVDLASETGLRVHVQKSGDPRFRELYAARLREIYTFGADRRALAQVKPDVAITCDAVPVRLEGDLEPVLVVVMADPSDESKIAMLRASCGMLVRSSEASRSAVRAAIRLAYHLDEALEMRAQRRRRAPARQKVEDLVFECFDQGGQNLFLEGTPEGGQVRFGIDGVKYLRYEYTREEFDTLITSVFNTGIGRGAEGEIGEGKMEIAGHRMTIYVRIVSFVAEFTGREAALRLHNTDTQPMDFAQAGMTGKPRAQLELSLAQHKDGIYLFVGPGDSGKTMSAVALFRRSKLDQLKVLGIGDPPEFYVRHLSQIAVSEQRPYGKIVGAILRSAADGMLPGEVRSMEDMVRVFDAGQTGGMVAITSHADNPFVAINRLSSRIDRSTIAGVVRAVIGQRLVRRLCIVCRKPSQLVLPDGRAQKFQSRRNDDGTSGCEACRWIGYSGRIGVFEVLRVNKAIAYAIERGVGPVQLEMMARKYGYSTLREDALDKCVEGVTDFAEVARVLAVEEDDSDPGDLTV